MELLAGVYKQVTEHLKWVDPKWVIGGLLIAVATGAVANFRVGDNAERLTEMREAQVHAVKEIHDIELRTVRLETQLENIEENTEEILKAVKD